MLPALRLLGQGDARAAAEVRTALAAEFRLTDEDIAQLLPSGRQTTFANRVAWAYSYLKQAGLIASPKRGTYQITDRGRGVLAESPTRIDIGFLGRFPEFQAFRQGPADTDAAVEPTSDAPAVNALTPDEEVRAGYRRLRAHLAAQLLERVKAVDHSAFERLVIDVLVALGYGGTHKDAASVVGGSGDEGIDGIIKEDRLGLDTIYIQAKHWQNSVGRPEIQRFAGALQGQRARKGIFITTSSFSEEARQYAANLQTSIVLIDGRALAELMMDAEIGVSVAESIPILRLDEEYFDGF